MARSRKKAAVAETPTHEAGAAVAEAHEPDVFDQAIADRQHQAATIVQHVADSTHLPPDVERQAAHEIGHAARHQHREEGRSHAETVGKREAGYTSAGKTDVVAGVKLKEYQDPERRIYLSVIKFDEKPSEEVRAKMSEAKFEWRQQNREWTRPIRFESRAQDRLNAERVFEDVAKTVREERGINHGYGSPA